MIKICLNFVTFKWKIIIGTSQLTHKKQLICTYLYLQSFESFKIKSIEMKIDCLLFRNIILWTWSSNLCNFRVDMFCAYNTRKSEEKNNKTFLLPYIFLIVWFYIAVLLLKNKYQWLSYVPDDKDKNILNVLNNALNNTLYGSGTKYM